MLAETRGKKLDAEDQMKAPNALNVKTRREMEVQQRRIKSDIKAIQQEMKGVRNRRK